MSKKNKKTLKGIIFNIQRYSIHDGPGIRTTVFMKGCPLRCKWCSNIESQNSYPELLFRKIKCDGCGKCVDVCPPKAIALNNGVIKINRPNCDLCMQCADICPTEALSRTGESKTIEQVVSEVSKDKIFYDNSGGGATISGGEPLFQPEFTTAFLKACQAVSLHTALDTCGFAKWEILNQALRYTDLVLFDLKHLDPGRHIAGTGVANELIIENLSKLIDKGQRVWIRIPVIPFYNDSEKHLKSMAHFLADKPVEKVSLLGYHKWGVDKYEALGRDYQLNDLSVLEEKSLSPFKDIMASAGLQVTLGY